MVVATAGADAVPSKAAGGADGTAYAVLTPSVIGTASAIGGSSLPPFTVIVKGMCTTNGKSKPGRRKSSVVLRQEVHYGIHITASSLASIADYEYSTNENQKFKNGLAIITRTPTIFNSGPLLKAPTTVELYCAHKAQLLNTFPV